MKTSDRGEKEKAVLVRAIGGTGRDGLATDQLGEKYGRYGFKRRGFGGRPRG